MKGQDILLDEFGTGAFSFVVVEGMSDKELKKVVDEIDAMLSHAPCEGPSPELPRIIQMNGSG